MAGVPIINPQDRARELAALRESFADNPGILRKMMMGLFEASKIPGDVYQGNREATPEAGMEFGMNFAGAGSMVPKPSSSLGIFGGKGAKTANHNMLRVAEDLEKAGVGSDDIWGFTGWGKGKDGKWRFEIDDSKAHLRQGAKEALEAHGELQGVGRTFRRFDHPELYAAYPDLQDIKVHQLSQDQSFLGTYQPWDDKIGLKQQFRPKMQSTLLHELQHSIQKREGFEGGGNPSQFSGNAKEADEKIGRINDSLRLVAKKMNAVWQKGSDPTGELDVLQRVYQRLMDYKLNEVVPLTDKYEHYRRVSGEVEARNVQRREKWDAQKRSNIPPEFTEDVPRSKQKNWDVR
jgi:hypothetical protein